MAKTYRYTLKDFNDIIFNGFNIDLSDETIKNISGLAKEVGSPDYVKTPIFKKKENPMKVEPILKRKKDSADDTAFQTTKLEEKSGVDAQIDLIRSCLNKMTDKNYIDIRNKLMTIIDGLVTSNDDMLRVSTIIFDIASNNRFFSKIYADLYTVLISKYDIMKVVFENSLNLFIQLFNTIEYVESTIDYDKFCRINKDNEKRKALSSFFINLMLNGVISKAQIIEITRNLMGQIYTFIVQENKKNEVDELTENISLLYRKELYNLVNNYELIDGMTIPETIHKLAHCKVKDYKSLTNKTIFKFMDLVEM
jgi:hypothetical protein